MASTAPALLLASTSRYRRALLERLGVPFECVDPAVDERAHAASGDEPSVVAASLARAKAHAVARTLPEAVVVGADQLVDLDDTILGKPGTARAARAQLRAMAGREHRLITAVCLCAPGRADAELLDVHRMRLRALTDAEIARYVEADAPLDCAGSYKIEGLGISLFASVVGEDFTAIEGLPLIALARLLREAGFDVP